MRKDRQRTAIKAVAPVVGFLLIIAILFLAAAQYQANVVPQEEKSEEADHFDKVNQDFNQLRTEIIRSVTSGQRQTQQINTGLNYDTLGLNEPPVPGVILYQDANNDIRIHGAKNEESASSYWQPDRVKTYETGYMSYRVDYNRLSNPGDLYIEHGIVYRDNIDGRTPREYKENIVDKNNGPRQRIIYESNQPIIDGKTITIYTIDDGYDKKGENLVSSGISKTNVEIIPMSPQTGGSINTITLTDNGNKPISIVLPTRIQAEEWKDNIIDDQMVSQNGYVRDVYDSGDDDARYINERNETDNLIEIELQKNQIYNLRMSKVNVQTQRQTTPNVAPDSQYIAVKNPVQQVPEESTKILEAEARDKYNNGVIGQEMTVEAQTESGNCIGSFSQTADSRSTMCDPSPFSGEQPGLDLTDEDGIAEFRYNSPQVSNDRSVNFIYNLVE